MSASTALENATILANKANKANFGDCTIGSVWLSRQQANIERQRAFKINHTAAPHYAHSRFVDAWRKLFCCLGVP